MIRFRRLGASKAGNGCFSPALLNELIESTRFWDWKFARGQPDPYIWERVLKTAGLLWEIFSGLKGSE
jgi:hypothetical protein